MRGRNGGSKTGEYDHRGRRMKLIKQIKLGNDCESCSCLWDNWNDYTGDGDVGCYIKGFKYNEKPCRLPKIAIKLFLRRAMYCEAHQYDGYEDHVREQEAQHKRVQKSLEEALKGHILCYRGLNGEFVEDKSCLLTYDMAYTIMNESQPEFVPRQKLKARWAALFKATLLYLPDKIKPFICK